MKRIIYYSLLLFCLATLSCANKETKQRPAAGAPLFTELNSSTTNIDFINLLQENELLNYFNTKYIYNGGGVAVGDINNDGLADIYFSSNIFSNKLYLNKGNFVFEDISAKAGVEASRGFKTGVAMADLNNDGFLDIYVCRSNHPDSVVRSNLVYINNKDLTFTEQSHQMGLEDQSYSTHVTFLDYDKDGDVDLYLVNHPIDFALAARVRLKVDVNKKLSRKTDPDKPSYSDKLFRNEGNGTFKDVSQQAGIWNSGFGLSASVIDINNDTYPDIYVANDFVEKDFLYVNNKDGSFSEQLDTYFRHFTQNSMGTDIADFNNDGLEDIVAMDMLPEDNFRQKSLTSSMVYERYNTLLGYGYGHQLMRNVLQLNNGDGTFSDIALMAGVGGTDWSWASLFADFDNDGWKDLLITNGIRRDMTNSEYIKFKNDSIESSLKKGESFVSVKNFKQWIENMPSTKIQNYLFQNNKDLTFKNVSSDWGFTAKTFTNGAAYADFDNDGDLDIVISNLDEKPLLYRNETVQALENHFLKIKLDGPAKNRSGVGAKVMVYAGGEKQLSELKITRGFLSSVEPRLHFGLGKSVAVDSLRVTWPDQRTELMRNVKADQLLEIEYENSSADKRRFKMNTPTPLFTKGEKETQIFFRHQENEFIDFKREPLLPHKFSQLGPFISVADINGDSLDDFYIGGAAFSSGALFIQQPNSTFLKTKQAELEADSVYEDMGAVFFDADNDGDQDLYVVSGGSEFDKGSPNYQDRLYINDGKGIFQRDAKRLPIETGSGSCVRACDFDRDGDLDLFVGGRIVPGRYPEAPRSYVLQNNKGYFKDVTATISPKLANIGLVTDARWADLDKDGFEELVLVGEWMPITLFKNENGKQLSEVTAQYGLTNTRGWWNSIAIADVDGDTDLDIVAGNLGLNSQLKASATEPLTLYAADFDNNKSIEAILCYYNQGKQWPWVRKEILVTQMPSINKKFVKFEKYAASSVEEVFGKDQLDKAVRLEATTLASSIFINEAGKFRQQALPLLAQMSPVNGIIVTDFNHDQITDLLIAGNNFSSSVELGRYDAGNGLLLKGSSDHTFSPVTPVQSGLSATGDVKDIALLKLANGKTALLVANNNDLLQVFILGK